MAKCVFCETKTEEKLKENKHAYVKKDHFPVSKGHLLVIPHRHVKNIWQLNDKELEGLWALVKWARNYNIDNNKTEAFNIGMNDGEIAGQTVFHLHIHVIPRYKGDMDDPKGGVRGVIPSKQKY